MKIALLFAAVALVSTNAFASKARKAAISSSVTAATDVQHVWSNAAKMHQFGDLMTFEFGTHPASVPTTPIWETQAIPEGGIFKSQGDAKWGFYVGHRSSALDLTKNVTGITSSTEYTPFALFYGKKSGDYAWGASLSYYSGKKTVGTAETSNEGMGLRLGASKDNWEGYVNLGLSAKETVTTTDEFKGNASYQIGGQYDLSDMTVYAELLSSSGTRKFGTTDIKGSYDSTFVGVERKLKSDNSHVYYGAKYVMAKLKNDLPSATETIQESNTLPLYFGLEADAASWLAFRGEVSKPFMLDTVKSKSAGTETKKEGQSNATVSFGASFKFNKSTLDWTASTASTGNLTTAGFGTNASYTYNF